MSDNTHAHPHTDFHVEGYSYLSLCDCAAGEHTDVHTHRDPADHPYPHATNIHEHDDIHGISPWKRYSHSHDESEQHR